MKGNSDFSLGFLFLIWNWAKEFRFFFLPSKLGKGIQFPLPQKLKIIFFQFLFLFLGLCKKICDFFFSSLNWVNECGFLFLFSKLVNGTTIFSFT